MFTEMDLLLLKAGYIQVVVMKAVSCMPLLILQEEK